MPYQRYEMPAFARSRNPERANTDVRLAVHRFTLSMIEAEVQFRLRHRDPDCNRNRVINEVLGDWANKRWEEAQIRMGLAPENPFVNEWMPVSFAEEQAESNFEEVRASIPKVTADIIEAEVTHRRAFTGVGADRASVINEILNAWANFQWHRSTMHLKCANSNPLHSDSQEAARG